MTKNVIHFSFPNQISSKIYLKALRNFSLEILEKISWKILEKNNLGNATMMGKNMDQVNANISGVWTRYFDYRMCKLCENFG